MMERVTTAGRARRGRRGHEVAQAEDRGRRPTLIYTYGAGRLGNQLLRFAHLLAWAEEFRGRARLVNFCFWPYTEGMAVWSRHPGCRFPLRTGFLDIVARCRGWMPKRFLHRADPRIQFEVKRASRRLPGHAWLDAESNGRPNGIDLEDEAFNHLVLSHRRTFISGWRIAGWKLLERHQARVRELLAPDPAAVSAAAARVARLRERHDRVAGLFIRQGDYRSWRGGRYFFPLESYRRWGSELARLQPGKRTCLLVAADGAVPGDLFAGMPVVFSSGSPNRGGSPWESLLELSCCDSIATPPSTFSAWASFVGRVPLLPLADTEQSLERTPLIADSLFGAARDPAFSEAVK